jgi:hypothetical protein
MQDKGTHVDEMGAVQEDMGMESGGELQEEGYWLFGWNMNGLTWAVMLYPLDALVCGGVISGGEKVYVTARKLCMV